MNESVDLSDLEDEPPARDFRRANGAPMVRGLDNPNRWDRYARPSGFGKDLDDESALVLWRIDRAMDGVATSPALAAKVAAKAGIKEGRKELRDEAIHRGRGEEDADMGTALHAMAHRLETEESFHAPEPYSADLAAYLTAIDRAGLESEHCEVHLCADGWRAAGTADRIYRARRELVLPDGTRADPDTRFIGDLKTGKRLDYSLPGFAVQLAIYADAVFYDVATDERSPLPELLHTGWGVLVHLPAGRATCTLWWVDLEIGRVGAKLVQGVRAWRKRDDFTAPFVYPEPDVAAVMDTTLHDLEHDLVDFTEPSEDEGWVTAMMPWAQDRINQIGLHNEARGMLMRKWPADIDPILVSRPTALQLTKILSIVDVIESAYSLPFCAGDPRVEWNQGLHHSQVERGYHPPSTKEQRND